jgi:hypothetical protein
MDKLTIEEAMTKLTIEKQLTPKQLESVKNLTLYLYKEKGYAFTIGFVFGVEYVFEFLLNQENPV